MRLLHTADLHIGKKVHGYSMLEEQRNILLNEIPRIILEEKVDVLLIAGDLYDTSIPNAQAVVLCNDFLTTISNLNISVFMIPGNHDSAERISFAADVLKKNNIYIAKPIDRDATDYTLEKYTMVDTYGTVNFYLLPFLRSADVKKVLQNTDINCQERNILLAHEFVTGVGINNIISDSEVLNVGGIENVDVSLFSTFDYVALGHLHASQSIADDCIRYAGSILKYSFSEVHQKKSVTIIEFNEKENIHIKKIPLIPINDMRVIEGPIEKLLSSEIYSEVPTNDYLQVILTDEEEIFDAMNRIRTIYPNVLRIDFNNTRTRAQNGIEKIEEIEKKSEIDLFREFYKNRTDLELSEKGNKVISEIFQEIRGEI